MSVRSSRKKYQDDTNGEYTNLQTSQTSEHSSRNGFTGPELKMMRNLLKDRSKTSITDPKPSRRSIHGGFQSMELGMRSNSITNSISVTSSLQRDSTDTMGMLGLRKLSTTSTPQSEVIIYLPDVTLDLEQNRPSYDAFQECNRDELPQWEAFALIWFVYYLQRRKCDSCREVINQCDLLHKYVYLLEVGVSAFEITDCDKLLSCSSHVTERCFDVTIYHHQFELAQYLIENHEIRFANRQTLDTIINRQQYALLKLLRECKCCILPDSSSPKGKFWRAVTRIRPKLHDLFEQLDFGYLVDYVFRSNMHATEKEETLLYVLDIWKDIDPERKTVKLLLERKLEGIAKTLISNAPDKNKLSYRIFMDALNMNNLKFALFFEDVVASSDEEEGLTPLSDSLAQLSTCDLLLQTGLEFEYGIYFLKRVITKARINVLIVKKVINYLNFVLIEKKVEEHTFLTTRNPILLAVNVVLVLQSLAHNFPQYSQTLLKQAESFVLVAEIMTEKITDEVSGRKILLDKDLEGRSLFDLLMNDKARFHKIIENKYVNYVLSELWDSNGLLVNAHFLSCSGILHILSNGSRQTKDTFPYVYTFFGRTKDNFRMQFSLWRESVYTRMMIQFLITLTCVLASNIYIASLVRAEYELSQYSSQPDDSPEKAEWLNNRAELERLQYILVLFLLAYISDMVLTALFVVKTTGDLVKAMKKLFNDTFMLDIIILCLSIRPIHFLLVDKEPVDHKELLILSLAFWIKNIFILQIFESFGLLIRLIFRMLLDIIKFLIILVSVLLCFCTLFIAFYGDEEKFSNYTETSLTLIDAMFGNYYVEILFSNESNRVRGRYLLVIFLFVTSILLLNLLIAILSNTYNMFNQRAKTDYSLTIYQIYHMYRYHPLYGALGAFPPILSAFQVPFLPYYLLEKDTKRLKRFNAKFTFILFSIFYIPVMVLIFVSANLLLMPIAHFKILFLLAMKNSSLKQRLSRCCIWFFAGMFILVFQICRHNTVSFVRQVLEPHTLFDVKKENSEILKADLEILIDLATQLKENQTTSLDYPEFIERFNANLRKSFMSPSVPGNRRASNHQIRLHPAAIRATTHSTPLKPISLQQPSRSMKRTYTVLDAVGVDQRFPLFAQVVKVATQSHDLFNAIYAENILLFMNKFKFFNKNGDEVFDHERFSTIIEQQNNVHYKGEGDCVMGLVVFDTMQIYKGLTLFNKVTSGDAKR